MEVQLPAGRNRSNKGGVGKRAISTFMLQYLQNGTRYVQTPKLLLITNKNMHMRFRLALGSMTLNRKTTCFPVLGVNISQTVRTAVARLPFHQLCFLVKDLNERTSVRGCSKPPRTRGSQAIYTGYSLVSLSVTVSRT